MHLRLFHVLGCGSSYLQRRTAQRGAHSDAATCGECESQGALVRSKNNPRASNVLWATRVFGTTLQAVGFGMLSYPEHSETVRVSLQSDCILSASRMERGDGLVKLLETAVPPCPAPRENICVASQNAGEVESLIGDPKFGWLKRLKRSHRR